MFQGARQNPVPTLSRFRGACHNKVAAERALLFVGALGGGVIRKAPDLVRKERSSVGSCWFTQRYVSFIFFLLYYYYFIILLFIFKILFYYFNCFMFYLLFVYYLLFIYLL